MSVSITPYFMECLFQLEKKMRKYTLDTISELENNPTNPALRLHKVDRTKCDPSFWSASVNMDVRMIYSLKGDHKTLLYVDHHDAAYDWCEGKYLDKTSFGAEMIYDEKAIARAEEIMNTPVFHTLAEKSLLEIQGIKKKQLMKIGINEVHAENLMKISDESQFLEYIQLLPQEIQEALLSLEIGDKTFDEVYIDLVDEDFQNGKTDVHKDTKRRIRLLQNIKELENILNQDDFEQWAIFLHPDQEKLVSMNFRGPALIEGGPGTGKTVVGMHRAVHLAENVFSDGKVLMCTFSRKLAKYIEEKLIWLGLSKNASCKNIDVKSIDSVIHAMYYEAFGKKPEIAITADIRNLIHDLYITKPPTSGSLAFYVYEYMEVIERFHIRTLEEYLACDRSGTGGPPLTASRRETAWKFLQDILDAKKQKGFLSFVDVAHEVVLALQEGKIVRKYNAIIIDEAQDLEPIKLELLNLYAGEGDNSLFILSDMNQRVFRLNSWKKDSKINIIGRTYYLSVNYRTTLQISEYARNQFVNSEMVTKHIRDYKSIMNGEPPVVNGFKDMKSQQQYIIEEVKALIAVYPPEQICIVCPRSDDCTGLSTLLEYHNVPNLILQKDILPQEGKGVNLCTIRGVKGLEFRVIILYNYTDIEKQCLDEAGKLEAVMDAYKKMAECEKYVATTRARDLLYITYVEDEEEDDE